MSRPQARAAPPVGSLRLRPAPWKPRPPWFPKESLSRPGAKPSHQTATFKLVSFHSEQVTWVILFIDTPGS